MSLVDINSTKQHHESDWIRLKKIKVFMQSICCYFFASIRFLYIDILIGIRRYISSKIILLYAVARFWPCPGIHLRTFIFLFFPQIKTVNKVLLLYWLGFVFMYLHHFNHTKEQFLYKKKDKVFILDLEYLRVLVVIYKTA